MPNNRWHPMMGAKLRKLIFVFFCLGTQNSYELFTGKHIIHRMLHLRNIENSIKRKIMRDVTSGLYTPSPLNLPSRSVTLFVPYRCVT